MGTQSFDDLKVWQLARRLMNECHKLTQGFPREEKYDLTSQIRRSSKSVMANIAEGYGRYHYVDKLRFFYYARGSLTETINHIITAHDLHYTDDSRHAELYNLGKEIEMILNGYINYSGNKRKARIPLAAKSFHERQGIREKEKGIREGIGVEHRFARAEPMGAPEKPLPLSLDPYPLSLF